MHCTVGKQWKFTDNGSDHQWLDEIWSWISKPSWIRFPDHVRGAKYFFLELATIFFSPEPCHWAAQCFRQKVNALFEVLKGENGTRGGQYAPITFGNFQQVQFRRTRKWHHKWPLPLFSGKWAHCSLTELQWTALVTVLSHQKLSLLPSFTDEQSVLVQMSSCECD